MATDSAASRGSFLGLEGSLFDGRFRIEERIAEGGFAVVYRAWQLALERRVALKVLKAPRAQDELARAEFRDRFAAEAKTIAKLRHPHIVDVYDFSVATLPSGELAPWMALEWLEGETLAKHLERRRREGKAGRDPVEAVEFLRPVLEALAHAHAHAIAHRDIKPSNVMVVETANGASLRVLDFGIAKIMVDDQAPNTGNTRTESTPAFSPAYAAPEQVAFSRTGPWTDVHALGLVLGELMTDQAPFSDQDPDAHLFEQVMARARPTPASKGRDVGAFEPILAKALALSPRDRWRSAGELLAALDAAKEHGSAFVPGASDTGPAMVVGGAPPLRARRRQTRSLALTGTAGLGLAVAWVLGSRTPAPKEAAAEAASTSSVAPMTEAIAKPVATIGAVAPVAAPPAATSAGAAPSVAAPRPTTAPPAVKARLRAPKPPPAASSALVVVGDGRDLFNDTK